MAMKKRNYVALIVLGSTAIIVAIWFGYLSSFLKVFNETERANDLLSAPEAKVKIYEGDPDNSLVPGIPSVGEFFAVIRIPALGRDWIRTISEGTTPEILDHLGVGHYEGTELPGKAGNFAIAGHSGRPWTPFAKLAEIPIGEFVEIETLTTKFIYEIIKTETVKETDVNTVYDNPEFGSVMQSEQWLTITTCLIDGPKDLRYVVYAKLTNQSARES